MTKFEDLSPIKRVTILSGLLLAALVVGASIGYFRGLYGDSGNVDRAIDWAVKTDLLCILLILVSIVFGKIEVFLESNWKFPFIPSFAIMMGFLFAIMNGAGVIMKMDSGEFRTSVFGGFIQGILGGGFGAILIKLTDKKNMSKNSTKAGSDS